MGKMAIRISFASRGGERRDWRRSDLARTSITLQMVCLISMPDEEFDVLGDDELALLTRQFKRLHENRVNMRRNTRTRVQCGKPGHFVTECSEKVKNKDSYKHMSKSDGKYRSRREHKSKHKD
jgi:cellulose biosynthesis protein BcsQ